MTEASHDLRGVRLDHLGVADQDRHDSSGGFHGFHTIRRHRSQRDSAVTRVLLMVGMLALVPNAIVAQGSSEIDRTLLAEVFVGYTFHLRP